MEFLIVRCAERRIVIIDDAPTFSLTNEDIQLDGGLHKIALALASDGVTPDPNFLRRSSTCDSPRYCIRSKWCSHDGRAECVDAWPRRAAGASAR